MMKRIWFRFEKMSIYRKLFLLVGVSTGVFVLLFAIVFSIIVGDMKDSVISRQKRVLPLLCTDTDNEISSIRDVAMSMVPREVIKDYIASNSTEEDKAALSAMMSRNFMKNFEIPTYANVMGMMVMRGPDDYVRFDTINPSDKGIYGRVARYISDNYTPGQTCIALTGYLGYVLDCYCYVLPLADTATPALQRGGYLVLLVNNSSFEKTLKRFYEANTTLTIIDSNYHTVFSNATGEEPDMAEVLEGMAASGRNTAKINGKNHLVLTQQLESVGWTVVMHTPMSSVMAQMQKYWILFAVFLLLLAGVTAVLINMISRSITSRLKEMVDVITGIREGDIDCRYPVLYNDEISIIGNEFNRMIDQIQTYHLNATVNELRRKEAELNALQSSINPHFLYNSLDCIRASALVHQDMRVAHQIQILANMFRYTTGSNSMRDNVVTVAEEMKHVKDYLSMINFRFEDRYHVEVQVDDAILSMRIPKLILQPVVENAFHHGIRNMAADGAVTVRGYLEEENLILSVEDNGVGVPADKLEKLRQMLQANPLSATENTPYRALVNINDRIRIAYGKEYGVLLESIPGGGTKTVLRLPVTKESRE